MNASYVETETKSHFIIRSFVIDLIKNGPYFKNSSLTIGLASLPSQPDEPFPRISGGIVEFLLYN